MLFAVNDVVEVKLYCHSEGQFSINTMHWKVISEAGGGSDDATWAGELSGEFPAPLKAVLSSQAEYIGLTVQIIRPTRRPKVVNTLGAGDGDLAGDILPRQVAGLIQKKTAVASRSGRGRMFVPFPPESVNTDDGFPVAGYKTNLGLLAVPMLTQFTSGAGGNTSTLAPVLYNRSTHATIPLTEASVSNTWGTCRRRADIRGADRFPF